MRVDLVHHHPDWLVQFLVSKKPLDPKGTDEEELECQHPSQKRELFPRRDREPRYIWNGGKNKSVLAG